MRSTKQSVIILGEWIFMKKILQKFNSLSTYARAVIIALFLLLILNFFSRISIISDFYTDHIFRHISTPLCMICGFAHFSVGEPAIVLAILFALSTLILAVVLIFLRKNEKYRHFAVKWIKSFFAFLIVVGALMTLNCSLPYGCSKLKTITIKSKQVKKVGTKAFDGINSKAKFKIPASVYENKKLLKKYKKLISKAGAPKKCVISK